MYCFSPQRNNAARQEWTKEWLGSLKITLGTQHTTLFSTPWDPGSDEMGREGRDQPLIFFKAFKGMW